MADMFDLRTVNTSKNAKILHAATNFCPEARRGEELSKSCSFAHEVWVEIKCLWRLGRHCRDNGGMGRTQMSESLIGQRWKERGRKRDQDI